MQERVAMDEIQQILGTETVTTAWLLEIPVWLLTLGVIAALIVSLEIGYFVGRTWHQPSEVTGNVTLGALLGLLGLAMAFTYGFGLTRLDENRDAITAAANAYGTAILRTDLLKDPDRSEMKAMLVAFVETRAIPWHKELDWNLVIRYTQRARDIEKKMWPFAVRASITLDPPARGWFLGAINDVYDTTTVARVAGRGQLPLAILIALLSTAMAAMFVAGNSAGSEGHMNRWRTSSMILVLSLLMLLILDMDKPLQGFVKVNDYAMQDLARSL